MSIENVAGKHPNVQFPCGVAEMSMDKGIHLGLFGENSVGKKCHYNSAVKREFGIYQGTIGLCMIAQKYTTLTVFYQIVQHFPAKLFKVPRKTIQEMIGQNQRWNIFFIV